MSVKSVRMLPGGPVGNAAERVPANRYLTRPESVVDAVIRFETWWTSAKR